MANGDVTIKTLYSQAIGGGRDADGIAKQGKRLSVGTIDGTYVSTGLAINKHGGAKAFGVDNLDFLYLEVITINTGGNSTKVYPTTNALFLANYDHVNQKIFVLEDCGAADPAKPSDADILQLRFVALGDDATVPELG
jgi:hypothetical protein